MSKQTENLLTGMADAGCTKEEIKGAQRFMETDSFEELTKHLKRCRSVLLDKMHESQKRVDRMDYLIRQAEKSQQKKKGWQDHDQKGKPETDRRMGQNLPKE